MVFVRAILFALRFVPARTTVFRSTRGRRDFGVMPDLRLVFSYPPHHHFVLAVFMKVDGGVACAPSSGDRPRQDTLRELVTRWFLLEGDIACRVVFSSALAIRAGRARLSVQRACVENPSSTTPIHERRRKLGPRLHLVK